MIERIRGRLSYANVIATLALLVALGGSSYAAMTLPRGSVGPAQIRNGAVVSRHVRHGSLHVFHLAPSARRALRGAQGPPGAPAAKFFAVVATNGDFLRGNATNGGHTAQGSGVYIVGFAQSVSGCAYTATLGTADGSTTPAGRIAVRDAGGRVGVQTYDAAGTPADLPFHLIVAC